MISHKIILLASLFLCALVAGCDEEAKTTKWYRDNPNELKTVYDECQRSGDISENCKNASEAQSQLKKLSAPTPDLNNLEE